MVRDSIPGRARYIFLFSATLRSAVGFTHPPILWLLLCLLPGVKRPRRISDHSLPGGLPRLRMHGAVPLYFPYTPSWRALLYFATLLQELRMVTIKGNLISRFGFSDFRTNVQNTISRILAVIQNQQLAYLSLNQKTKKKSRK